jgi:hypothetical protein
MGGWGEAVALAARWGKVLEPKQEISTGEYQ